MIAVLKQRAHKHLFKQFTKMRKNQCKETELTELYFGYGQISILKDLQKIICMLKKSEMPS